MTTTTAHTTTARHFNNTIVVTFADGTTETSTRGKRADAANYVVIADWGQGEGIWSLNGSLATAQSTLKNITTYRKPMCVNPAKTAYIVEVPVD